MHVLPDEDLSDKSRRLLEPSKSNNSVSLTPSKSYHNYALKTYRKISGGLA